MLHRSRATIAVHVPLEPPAGERVIRITAGDELDLDQVVRPARPGIDPMTLREALGEHVQYFDACGLPLADDPSLPRLAPPSADDLDPTNFTTAVAAPGATLPDSAKE